MERWKEGAKERKISDCDKLIHHSRLRSLSRLLGGVFVVVVVVVVLCVVCVGLLASSSLSSVVGLAACMKRCFSRSLRLALSRSHTPHIAVVVVAVAANTAHTNTAIAGAAGATRHSSSGGSDQTTDEGGTRARAR